MMICNTGIIWVVALLSANTWSMVFTAHLKGTVDTIDAWGFIDRFSFRPVEGAKVKVRTGTLSIEQCCKHL
jgi:hypothetical protein